jgi:thiamine-monophosphate kinase
MIPGPAGGDFAEMVAGCWPWGMPACTIAAMESEFTLIDQAFRAGAPSRWPGTEVPNGDDASVHACEPGMAWVVSTDTAVCGVHWPADFPLDRAAERAVRAALSDLAAMGAEARLVWVGVMAPDAAAVRLMGKGVCHAVDHFGLELAGGDTVQAPLATLFVTVAGILPEGTAMRRDTAEVGDDVWLAGRVGFSAMGLERWLAGDRDREMVAPFAEVEPLLATGVAVRELGVRCCIDVSDGLAQDAGHVAAASGVQLHLDLGACEGWEKLVAMGGKQRAVALALAGGEDYALLLTAPVGLRESLAGLAHRIGDCRAGRGVVASVAGKPVALPAHGYDHFAQDGDS